TRFNPGLGGCPAGSDTVPDITFDDIPIPAQRLTPTSALLTRINVCQITVGIREIGPAPATDLNVYWASYTSNAVAPDTDVDTPPHLITDGTSPVSTLAGSPFIGTTVTRSLPALTNTA